jgi:hypothetical protein
MQSSDTDAEVILSRFPGPVTLYSSRRKWLRHAIWSSLFAVAGLLMVSYEISGGWFILSFFAALVPLCVGMLLPGASALKLDDQGFQVTKFFRSRSARWRDVKNFEAIAQAQGSVEKIIVYDDVKSIDGIIETVNKTISGHNAYLPDTYGIAGEKLAGLMGRWRDRAAGPE